MFFAKNSVVSFLSVKDRQQVCQKVTTKYDLSLYRVTQPRVKNGSGVIYSCPCVAHTKFAAQNLDTSLCCGLHLLRPSENVSQLGFPSPEKISSQRCEAKNFQASSVGLRWFETRQTRSNEGREQQRELTCIGQTHLLKWSDWWKINKKESGKKFEQLTFGNLCDFGMCCVHVWGTWSGCAGQPEALPAPSASSRGLTAAARFHAALMPARFPSGCAAAGEVKLAYPLMLFGMTEHLARSFCSKRSSGWGNCCNNELRHRIPTYQRPD